MRDKIRVAVLYGGRSGEHEVSLLSAANVIHYLDSSRFDVVPIGIDKQGVWFLGEENLKKELQAPKPLKLMQEAERMLFNPLTLAAKNTSLTPSTERLFDVIFPVIH